MSPLRKRDGRKIRKPHNFIPSPHSPSISFPSFHRRNFSITFFISPNRTHIPIGGLQPSFVCLPTRSSSSIPSKMKINRRILTFSRKQIRFLFYSAGFSLCLFIGRYLEPDFSRPKCKYYTHPEHFFHAFNPSSHSTRWRSLDRIHIFHYFSSFLCFR